MNKILIGFFFFYFTVTLCVSWEEWWTYDGISGKFCNSINLNQWKNLENKNFLRKKIWKKG